MNHEQLVTSGSLPSCWFPFLCGSCWHALSCPDPVRPKPHPPTTPLLPTLLIPRPTSALTNSNSKTNVLPKVDSTVLCRVTRTQTRQATVAILVVDDAVCADEFQGVIRREDVRATEKDRVVLGASFVPGDVVRAVVISLGDQSNYYLSTARNELGVVMAASEAGNAMYPVSWKEFRDPVTGEMEARKVAKPF
ncbi:exosome 3'-_5 exonuclease subunit ski4 (Csl4) [Acarospora aff. strigata]|nr:exosome 3'->5 exonuclease subunit ski4 (Csl4) [Acarospora aff. strigata]